MYYPSVAAAAAEPLHFSESKASFSSYEEEVAKNLDNCKAYYETELRQKCVQYTDQASFHSASAVFKLTFGSFIKVIILTRHLFCHVPASLVH